VHDFKVDLNESPGVTVIELFGSENQQLVDDLNQSMKTEKAFAIGNQDVVLNGKRRTVRYSIKPIRAVPDSTISLHAEHFVLPPKALVQKGEEIKNQEALSRPRSAAIKPKETVSTFNDDDDEDEVVVQRPHCMFVMTLQEITHDERCMEALTHAFHNQVVRQLVHQNYPTLGKDQPLADFISGRRVPVAALSIRLNDTKNPEGADLVKSMNALFELVTVALREERGTVP
jgi:hypothetical protein